MAKRGFPPRGEYTNKSQVLSTRIRADTRAALETAAKASGRSLSQEIEHRLRRSFTEDDQIADRFGNRRTYHLFQIAADVANALSNPDRQDADWLDDPNLFDAVVVAINGVLRAVRPAGAKAEPSWPAKEVLETRPAGVLAATFYTIQSADPGDRFDPKKEHWKAKAATRKVDLGEVAMRPKIETLPTQPGHATIRLAGFPDRIASKPKRKRTKT